MRAVTFAARLLLMLLRRLIVCYIYTVDNLTSPGMKSRDHSGPTVLITPAVHAPTVLKSPLIATLCQRLFLDSSGHFLGRTWMVVFRLYLYLDILPDVRTI
jgi:hypothetical protein